MSREGRLAGIFRYPVKSMQGERLERADLGIDGSIAVVTAGWQERETEDSELREHVARDVVNRHVWLAEYRGEGSPLCLSLRAGILDEHYGEFRFDLGLRENGLRLLDLDEFLCFVDSGLCDVMQFFRDLHSFLGDENSVETLPHIGENSQPLRGQFLFGSFDIPRRCTAIQLQLVGRDELLLQIGSLLTGRAFVADLGSRVGNLRIRRETDL